MPWFDLWPDPLPAGDTAVPFPFQAANLAAANSGQTGPVTGPYRTLGAAEKAKPPQASPTPSPGPVTGGGGNSPVGDPAAVRLAALNFATAQIGKPYIWGGDGPPQSAGFDCSGLTYESYLHAGVTIPRVAAAQQSAGTVITVDQLQPADLVFAGTPAFHVGMFAGSGQIVVSDQPGTNVRMRAFDPNEWTGGFRSMVAGGIVLTGFNPGGIIGSAESAWKLWEGIGAIAKILTPNHLERAGKFALGLVIAIGAVIILNRKKIESAVATTAKDAVKVAEVIPK